MTIPSSLTHLHDALPANPGNDGPIGVEASDLRAVLADCERYHELCDAWRTFLNGPLQVLTEEG